MERLILFKTEYVWKQAEWLWHKLLWYIECKGKCNFFLPFSFLCSAEGWWFIFFPISIWRRLLWTPGKKGQMAWVGGTCRRRTGKEKGKKEDPSSNLCVYAESLQLCLTLLPPHELYSLPGFSVHGILQARILEWITISFSAQRANMRLFCLLHWQVSSLPLVPLGKLTLISGSSNDTTQPASPTSWSSLAPCREEKRSSKWKEQLKWKSMSSLLCHYLKLIFCITSYNYI